MLEIAGLKTEFHVRDRVYRAVGGVDLSLKPGECLGIIGESGSGKSVTALAIMAPGSFSSPGALLKRKRPRTHVSSTEILDPVYTPRLPVHERYRSWFEPTWITDHEGALNPELEADALATRFKRSTQKTASGEVA